MQMLVQGLQFSMTGSQHGYLSIVRIEKLVAVILSHAADTVGAEQLHIRLLL